MVIVANPRTFKIPDWFLNRQKDHKDGRYSQLTSSALDTKLRDDLERLKKIRCARVMCYCCYIWGTVSRGCEVSDTKRSCTYSHGIFTDIFLFAHLLMSGVCVLTVGMNARVQQPSRPAALLGPAYQGPAHQDHRPAWQDRGRGQEAVRALFCLIGLLGLMQPSCCHSVTGKAMGVLHLSWAAAL